MELVKVIDGQPKPYTEAAFRADNPHTVYGKVVPAKHLNAQGVYRVRTLGKPDVPTGKKAVKDTLPTLNEYNEWVLGWTLVTLNADEARDLRNKLLSDCDWIVVKASEAGEPVAPEWATYRQDLRDIPEQAGFPYSVIWPTRPE
jgi:hypothetical protein